MLNELKKYQLSLLLIGTLILIRFIVVPLLDWQNNVISDISRLQSQEIRVEQVLRNKDNNREKLAQVNAELEKKAELFFYADNPANFQLQQLQWLESAVDEFDVQIENSSWALPIEVNSLNVTGHTLQIGLAGKTKNVFRFIQFIQAQQELIEVQNFTIHFSRFSQAQLGTAKLRLHVVFYRTAIKA